MDPDRHAKFSGSGTSAQRYSVVVSARCEEVWSTPHPRSSIARLSPQLQEFIIEDYFSNRFYYLHAYTAHTFKGECPKFQHAFLRIQGKASQDLALHYGTLYKLNGYLLISTHFKQVSPNNLTLLVLVSCLYLLVNQEKSAFFLLGVRYRYPTALIFLQNLALV